MPGIRRAITGVILAGGMVATAQLPALASAKVGPSLTISASSKIGKLFGYVAVGYRSGTYSTATISGTVTGPAATDVVKLYAQPFPYKKAATVVATSAALGTATTYKLTAKPNVATRYTTRLFASATATAPLASSVVQTVYVLATGAGTTGVKLCARPTCHETITVRVYTPASSLGMEMAKKVYPYLAVNVSPTKAPAPHFVYLNAGKATVGKMVRVHADEFRFSVSYTFTVGNNSYAWNWTACTKDAVTADGVGLPGHHGCGGKKISVTVTYLG